MDVLLYLLIGLGVMGGLYWTLNQITRRQRKVDQDLRRLEELTAEVTLNAGAVLEQADDRIALLQELLQAVELKAAEEPAPTVAESEKKAPAPAPASADRPKDSSVEAATPVDVAPAALATPLSSVSPAEPGPAATPGPAPAASEPVPAEPAAPISSLQRYQALRSAVWALADQGLDPVAIAKKLGVPRGEVQLMLSLRSRRVTA